MEHQLEVKVPVNEAKELKTNQQHGDAGENSLSRYERALMGICVIFGISGISFWWKGRRMCRKIDKEH